MDLEEVRNGANAYNKEQKEQNATNAVSTNFVNTADIVSQTIKDNAQKTSDVKEVINLAATQKAIEQEGTVEKLVDEKTEELLNDAAAKKIASETKKINEEVDKVRAEAEKEIAELNKSIANKKAEYEELVAQDRKADAYFTAHKSILRCVGVREKLSVKAMKGWLYPASVIYALFQIVLLPLTIIGFAIEQIINIVGVIGEKVTKQGWKIAVSILMVIIIIGLVFGAYFGFGQLMSKVF